MKLTIPAAVRAMSCLRRALAGFRLFVGGLRRFLPGGFRNDHKFSMLVVRKNRQECVFGIVSTGQHMLQFTGRVDLADFIPNALGMDNVTRHFAILSDRPCKRHGPFILVLAGGNA